MISDHTPNITRDAVPDLSGHVDGHFHGGISLRPRRFIPHGNFASIRGPLQTALQTRVSRAPRPPRSSTPKTCSFGARAEARLSDFGDPTLPERFQLAVKVAGPRWRLSCGRSGRPRR